MTYKNIYDNFGSNDLYSYRSKNVDEFDELSRGMLYFVAKSKFFFKKI